MGVLRYLILLVLDALLVRLVYLFALMLVRCCWWVIFAVCCCLWWLLLSCVWLVDECVLASYYVLHVGCLRLCWV